MTPEDQDEAALNAIRNGAATNGAVASKSGLGVTIAYRAINRLLVTGKIVITSDGRLSVGEG